MLAVHFFQGKTLTSDETNHLDTDIRIYLMSLGISDVSFKRSYFQIIKVLTPLNIFPFLLLIFRISPSLSSFRAHTLLTCNPGWHFFRSGLNSVFFGFPFFFFS